MDRKTIRYSVIKPEEVDGIVKAIEKHKRQNKAENFIDKWKMTIGILILATLGTAFTFPFILILEGHVIASLLVSVFLCTPFIYKKFKK